jgi:peptide deformylase
MIREIVELGNPLLRRPSSPVPDPCALEVASLARDLFDTLHDFQARTGYGRGIAAPQVGMAWRVVAIDIPGGSGPFILVNPEVVERGSGEGLVWDACFSYWGFFFQVRRSRSIVVSYLTPAGEQRRLEASGDLAELLQHEIDHLDGILAIDRITDPSTLRTLKEHERCQSTAARS